MFLNFYLCHFAVLTLPLNFHSERFFFSVALVIHHRVTINTSYLNIVRSADAELEIVQIRVLRYQSRLMTGAMVVCDFGEDVAPSSVTSNA